MLTRRKILQGIAYILSAKVISQVGVFNSFGGTLSDNPMPISEIAELLKAVKDRISRPEDWCKFLYKDGTKRCLTSAWIEELNLRYGRQIKLEEGVVFRPNFDQNEEPSCHYLILARKELFPNFVWRDLEPWNDDPETTHDDVLRLLDRAIECASNVEVEKEALKQIG
jgi:hypothetical protein